eukprot:1154601-Pelagomonas_calceolata.AAC.8
MSCLHATYHGNVCSTPPGSMSTQTEQAQLCTPGKRAQEKEISHRWKAEIALEETLYSRLKKAFGDSGGPMISSSKTTEQLRSCQWRSWKASRKSREKGRESIKAVCAAHVKLQNVTWKAEGTRKVQAMRTSRWCVQQVSAGEAANDLESRNYAFLKNMKNA